MSITVNNCKVCRHELRDEIEALLARGETYRAVVDYANKHAEDGTVFTPKNIWNHDKKHRIPTRREVRGPSKPIPVLEKEAKKYLAEAGLMSLTDFLDLIIAKATEGILSKSITPNVTEAVKAAEIQSRIRDGNPHEKEIVNFFIGISNDHGITKRGA